MRRREIKGDRCRGLVRKAMPVRSAVVVKTLRRPSTSAPPKVGSIKYFCPSSQITSSRADGPEGHGVGCAASFCCGSKEESSGDESADKLNTSSEGVCLTVSQLSEELE